MAIATKALALDETLQRVVSELQRITGVTSLAELDDLLDVDASNPSNGDIIQYNSTSQKWEKKALPSAALEDVTSKIVKASGIVLDSGFTYKAFKNDKIVTLFVNGTISSGYSSLGTEYTLFDIDSSILPVVNAVNYALGAGSSNARIHAYSAGTVKTTAGGWVRAELMWYIA